MTVTDVPLATPELARMSSDLRLACMRISRRIRFEATSDIAPHQLSVLARLEVAPATPGELADVERVSAPSMTRTVARLAERGLLERHPDPRDGRQVLVALTPAGRAILDATRREREAWMASRVARLTGREQRILAEAEQILSRMASE